jgi:hypothetical protein
VNHYANPAFWWHYRQLPPEVLALADKNFALLRTDPRHPSLRLKPVGGGWSARVGLHYRAVARLRPEGLVWFWIGPHHEYDRMLAIGQI